MVLSNHSVICLLLYFCVKLLKVLEESSTVEKASADNVNEKDIPAAEAVVTTNVGPGTKSTNDSKRPSTENKGTPTKRKKAKK